MNPEFGVQVSMGEIFSVSKPSTVSQEHPFDRRNECCCQCTSQMLSNMSSGFTMIPWHDAFSASQSVSKGNPRETHVMSL